MAIICLVSGTIIHAQKIKVSEIVQKAFSQKFPTAKNVKWDKEGKDEFEAAFEIDGKKGSANYNINGEWLETEIAINSNLVPKIVLEAVTKKHPTAIINNLFKIKSKAGKNYYEIEYTLQGKTKEAKVSTEGVIMK